LLFEKSELDNDEASYGVRAMYKMLLEFMESHGEQAETTP
jgi:hypothetical protein